MRSLGYALIHCDYKKGKFHTGNQCENTWGESHVKMEAQFELIELQAKEHKDCWLPPEARKRGNEGFYSASQREDGLLILIRDSNLQNEETITFCCFKSTNLSYFWMAALANRLYRDRFTSYRYFIVEVVKKAIIRDPVLAWRQKSTSLHSSHLLFLYILGGKKQKLTT